MEWISVKDRLPEPDQFVIGWVVRNYHMDTNFVLGQYCQLYNNKEEMYLNCGDRDGGIESHEVGEFTHWMPLPEPPAEE